MPTSDSILESLGQVARQWYWLAIFWHVVLAVTGLSWMLGWKPTGRFIGWIGVAMMLSVCVLAWMAGNPVNGSVFAVAATFAALFAVRSKTAKFQAQSSWAFILGSLMVAFAWCYPHFLASETGIDYLYAAPMGLIPCPTIAIMIGLYLVSGLYIEKGLLTMLTLLGIFYGTFGAIKLAVSLDWVLLLGTAGFAVLSVNARHRSKSELRSHSGSRHNPAST